MLNEYFLRNKRRERDFESTSKGFSDSLNMRLLVEEKEIIVTIGSKISDLSASKDILDLKSLIFAVVKVKNEKILKIRVPLSWLVSHLYLGTSKCLMDSQAVLLSLTYFRNFLLVVLELFSASDSPPNFSFIPAALAFEAPWPSDLVLGGPVSSHP